MTKIWLLSDLHQEFVRDEQYGSHPDTRYEPTDNAPSDFDVVVLAGDIDVPLTRSLMWIADRFQGVPTIYVPGNHDFYVDHDDNGAQYTIFEQMDAGRELAAKLDIHLLMDDTVTLAGSRFIGATLWTDFATVGRGNVKAKQAEAAGRYGMVDYKRIKRPSSKYEGRRKRLRPEDTIAMHRASRTYIESTLAILSNEPTVVVTHHAPNAMSLDPKKVNLQWCYASNLSTIFELNEAPDLWLHGHIHRAVDYAAGKTRVVSNPRGYLFPTQREGNDHNNGFNPELVVDVSAAEFTAMPKR